MIFLKDMKFYLRCFQNLLKPLSVEALTMGAKGAYLAIVCE